MQPSPEAHFVVHGSHECAQTPPCASMSCGGVIETQKSPMAHGFFAVQVGRHVRSVDAFAGVENETHEKPLPQVS